MAEVCDLSYLLQVRQMREQAHTQMALAPYMEQQQDLPTPESAEADFAAWLEEEPPEPAAVSEDMELHELLMGGRRGRGANPR